MIQFWAWWYLVKDLMIFEAFSNLKESMILSSCYLFLLSCFCRFFALGVQWIPPAVKQSIFETETFRVPSALRIISGSFHWSAKHQWSSHLLSLRHGTTNINRNKLFFSVRSWSIRGRNVRAEVGEVPFQRARTISAYRNNRISKWYHSFTCLCLTKHSAALPNWEGFKLMTDKTSDENEPLLPTKHQFV